MSDANTPLPSQSPDETFITSPKGDVPTQSSLNPVDYTSSGATRPAAPGGMIVDVGSQLGPYQLIAKLGEGGMGAVFKARHTKLGKLVALKILPPHVMSRGDALARFEREMLAVGSLQHPNIVQAHDAGDVNGVHYLSMEFVEGQDLQKLVQDKGPLSIVNACKAIRQAAQGLAAAHKLGLVHRDIKPSNLFVTKQTGQIKILDMGLALLSHEEVPAALTSTGQCFGTPDYMAPEQWSDAHTCDGRADLYSLGCTLFYLLTGQPPFPTETHRSAANKMKGHVMDPAPDLRAARPDIPAELDAIYRRLMAKLPEDRFDSASELADALAPFSTSKGTTTFRDKGSMTASDSLPATMMGTDLTRDRTTADATAAADPFSATSTWAPGSGTIAPPSMNAATTTRSGRRRLLAVGGIAVLLLIGGVVITTVDRDTTGPKSTPVDNSGLATTANGDGSATQAPPATEVPATTAPENMTATPPAVDAGDTERLPNTFTNRMGMEFVLIGKGTGWLGGGGGQRGEKKVEFPEDFYLGRYEVTQAEWQQVTGLTPSWFSRTGHASDAVKAVTDDDLKRFPVENVSWEDAALFLERLNKQEPSAGWIYRLPTADESEYACRGGPLLDKLDSAFDYYFDKPTNELQLHLLNYSPAPGEGLQRTCKVGSYPADRLGLYDMHGNVFEWCDDAGQVAEDGSPQRIHRGGDWLYAATDCRAAVRMERPASYRECNLGLRVARVRANATTKAPPAPATATIDFAAEREVADWVRANNGTLTLETLKGWIQPAKDMPLPSDPFVIRIIDLREVPAMTDDDMLRISRCQYVEELTLLGAPRLTPKSVSAITQLSRLKLLNLSTPGIPTSALVGLSKMPTLDLLKVTGDMIDDRLKFLQQVPELRKFLIYDWRSNQLDLSLIPDATGLRELELAVPNLPTRDELVAIQRKHGRLRILFGLTSYETINPDPVLQAAKALIALGVECRGIGTADNKPLTVADLDDGKTWFIEARKVPASVQLSPADRQQLPRLTMQHFTAEGQHDADQLAEILVQNKSLSSVTLHDCDLTDAGLAHFQKLPSLRYITVTNAKVTAAGIQQLHKALPGTAIFSDVGKFSPVQITAMKAQSQPPAAP